MSAILFLDFDGVLHPSTLEIEWISQDGKLTARADGLFMHLDRLAEALAPFPGLDIVISSSWRNVYPIDDLREVLGPLGGRVIDTTGRRIGTRWQDIEGYLSRRAPVQWLAIDDDNRGWPGDLQDYLICTNPLHGLTQVDLDTLVDRLQRLAPDASLERERGNAPR